MQKVEQGFPIDVLPEIEYDNKIYLNDNKLNMHVSFYIHSEQ